MISVQLMLCEKRYSIEQAYFVRCGSCEVAELRNEAVVICRCIRHNLRIDFVVRLYTKDTLLKACLKVYSFYNLYDNRMLVSFVRN